MLIEERRNKIVEYVEKQGRATVAELTRVVFASEPTVRRDLTALEKFNRIRKVYGGAMANKTADREIPMELRENAEHFAKDEMAKRAVRFVKDGDVVMLDGSSSVMAMVKYLADFKELIVITNGAKTAVACAEHGIRTYSTGGKMITNSFCYVGQQAENFVRGINADILFFSCHGLTEDGRATDRSTDEVELRRVMMRQTKKHVLLCDKSKIGKEYFYNLCTKDEIDEIISE